MTYEKFKHQLVQSMLNGATVKAALLGASYVPGNNEFWSDVSSHEVAGTGYTAGGQALSAITLANGVFDASNPSWSITGSLTAHYAVFYIDTGNPATSRLISYKKFPVARTVINGVFNLEIPETGIFRLQ